MRGGGWILPQIRKDSTSKCPQSILAALSLWQVFYTNYERTVISPSFPNPHFKPFIVGKLYNQLYRNVRPISRLYLYGVCMRYLFLRMSYMIQLYYLVKKDLVRVLGVHKKHVTIGEMGEKPTVQSCHSLDLLELFTDSSRH